MWLRDSANQLQSYRPLLRPSSSSSSLASLFRGAINLQSRYILSAPHCNAFHAPPESNLSASSSFSFTPSIDSVTPSPPPTTVFECKYELDSLAAFLQLSHDYHSATHDTAFFTSPSSWVSAISTLLETTSALLEGTYLPNGAVAPAPYTFQRSTSSAYETLGNMGVGAPVRGGTGMVRSAFRPSDDACVYQLFVPGNMMFSRYLGLCAEIMEGLEGGSQMAGRMRKMAERIREGVERYGRVYHKKYGRIYGYEVDGFGGVNAMVSSACCFVAVWGGVRVERRIGGAKVRWEGERGLKGGKGRMSVKIS